MARKTKYVKIVMSEKDDDGKPIEFRDRGKVFLLTELSARETEKWAQDALAAMLNAGLQPPSVQEWKQPSAAMAHRGFEQLAASGRINSRDLDPLLDKMMECIRIVPDPAADYSRPVTDGDIEETMTLFYLRMEVFRLHMDFSPAVLLSLLRA